MSARILDGNAIAKALRADIRERARVRTAAGRRPPGLAVILVGNDPASEIYVRHKRNDCQEVGFHSSVSHLPADISQQEMAERIIELNHDASIDGILVQLPLPAHLDAARLVDLIDPAKDVDGIHPFNIGRLALRRPTLRSCTPKGVMLLLEHTGVAIRGLDVTVIGASNHVGRPMGLELLLAGCTVTTAHKFSRDARERARSADVLVCATGKAGLVRGDWIKPGAIVIDVGITRDAKGRLHGDVAFDEAVEVASWITPVPGGVGPMTRAAMLDNTLLTADGAIA
jgi:methylenetetrahydrofolate dehydrogenase (NADP+) / methenyltetrahydrofolate cyclohydrolase